MRLSNADVQSFDVDMWRMRQMRVLWFVLDDVYRSKSGSVGFHGIGATNVRPALNHVFPSFTVRSLR